MSEEAWTEGEWAAFYELANRYIDAANALIRNNRARLGKNLWTSEGKGEMLRGYEAATDIDEPQLKWQALEDADRSLDSVHISIRAHAGYRRHMRHDLLRHNFSEQRADRLMGHAIGYGRKRQ